MMSGDGANKAIKREGGAASAGAAARDAKAPKPAVDKENVRAAAGAGGGGNADGTCALFILLPAAFQLSIGVFFST